MPEGGNSGDSLNYLIINYVSEIGTAPTAKRISSSTSVFTLTSTVLPEMAVDGYAFYGWSYNGAILSVGDTITDATEITVTAIWGRVKKFLDANGLTYFASKFNDYPTNEILGTVIDAIGTELENKANVPIIIDCDLTEYNMAQYVLFGIMSLPDEGGEIELPNECITIPNSALSLMQNHSLYINQNCYFYLHGENITGSNTTVNLLFPLTVFDIIPNMLTGIQGSCTNSLGHYIITGYPDSNSSSGMSWKISYLQPDNNNIWDATYDGTTLTLNTTVSNIWNSMSDGMDHISLLDSAIGKNFLNISCPYSDNINTVLLPLTQLHTTGNDGSNILYFSGTVENELWTVVLKQNDENNNNEESIVLDRKPLKSKISLLTDISGTPSKDGQTIIYHMGMTNDQPYTWDYPVVDWAGECAFESPNILNKPLKFALSKAKIKHGQKTSVIGSSFFSFDEFNLDSSWFYDMQYVVRDASTRQVLATGRPKDVSQGITRFEPFNVNGYIYNLNAVIGARYNYDLSFSSINKIHTDGTEVTFSGFFLLETPEGTASDEIISNIPFDIDIYILYPTLIGTYEQNFYPTVENSIFYDIDLIKLFMSNFSATPQDGWFKLSNKPLLYKYKDTFMFLGRNTTTSYIQYYTTGTNLFEIPNDIIQIMNQGIIHTNQNGYDFLQMYVDGTLYPIGKSDENGFYMYWPVISNATSFNSGLIITYEIDNPLFYSSPLTGTPTAPTAAAGTATTQLATTAFVQTAVANASSGLLKRLIVSTLPTSNVDTNTIYMIAKTTGETNNAYNEFMYINNSWELIGDTDTTVTVDTTITQNSTNAISSGAVYAAIGDIETLLEDLL